MKAELTPLFESLTVIFDGSRSGSMNMAVDHALLITARMPVLRVYDWDQPTVSIGYSHRIDDLRARLPAWPVVRRWTGGGVVQHRNDSTYALAVPAAHPWAKTRPVQSYHDVHERLVAALIECGVDDCRLANAEDQKQGAFCFAAPALSDVLRGQVKIAGAGQRRSRDGVLHQGSITLRLSRACWEMFAHLLASGSVFCDHVDDVTLSLAEELAVERYQSIEH